jgi:AcrR family transcriptional regulator
MGRREEKKAETRERLRAAAFARFEQRGYDATKIEDIARDAGVSPRTVYRYFPTKAQLVFAATPATLEQLTDLIAARPRSERPYTALWKALLDFVPNLDSSVGIAQSRIIAANPTLYRSSLEYRDQIAAAMGEALIKRGGPGGTDADRRLLGHLGMAALLVAAREWRNAGPERKVLRHYLDATLASIPRLARMPR